MTAETGVNTESLRTELLRRRDELLADLAAEAWAHQPVEVDETSEDRLARVEALQNQAIALESERRHRQELQRIEAALRRMNEGEYGLCVTCGEEIAVARLGLDPAAATCIACARSSGRR